MNSRFSDIDHAIKCYIAQTIETEIQKDLEELIFFSSYTINFEIFKKSTNKLKKILRDCLPYEKHVWEIDAANVIALYQLEITYPSERYTYLLQSLLKAQIKINEAVMNHFVGLYKKAHSFEYLERRTEEIYRLLFDDLEKENVRKTSS